MQKTMPVTLRVLMFAALLWSIGCRQQPAPIQETERITVAQWGQEKYLIYLPLYVAIEDGYFSRNGLNIDIKYTGNDDQTFAAVISGDAQFGIGDPVFAAISRERGFPAKVVGTIVGGVAIWGVTNKATVQEIKRPEDLAGLRVGTFPEPSTNFTLMKETIEKNPGALGGTRIVQAPIGAQVALLESGAADIAMELEPAASIAESKGYRVVYSSPRFYGPYAFTGVTTTEKYTKEKPELVQKFIGAIEGAVVACHRDPEIAVRVAHKIFPTLQPSVVSAAIHRMLTEKTFPEHVVVSEAAWQRALLSRLSVGDLKKPQATSLTVDNTFAQKAGG